VIINDTPLHWAARNGFLNLVEYLVNHGCGFNERNNEGKTPLDLSRANEKLNVVEFLLMKGAK